MTGEAHLPPVGFIGLGNMGLPMATNLLKAGYRLRVFNRTPERHASMSTVSPATASKLAEDHKRIGVIYLAAPVLGRPEVAAAGKLWVFLAGPTAAKEKVHPLLRVIGQTVFTEGGTGKNRLW